MQTSSAAVGKSKGKRSGKSAQAGESAQTPKAVQAKKESKTSVGRPAAKNTGTTSGATPVRSAKTSSVSGAARLDVGMRLPDAVLPDQDGKPFKLSSLRGKASVVYFYPKDDTPGCTREACAFQEQLATIARLGARVVGISPDASVRHTKFAQKYGLEFTLLDDSTRDYAKQCGVLVPKTLYGRTSIGIERTTFLLDAKGTVTRVWRKVKVDGHVEQVVTALRAQGS